MKRSIFVVDDRDQYSLDKIYAVSYTSCHYDRYVVKLFFFKNEANKWVKEQIDPQNYDVCEMEIT